jgi:trigger factor
LALREQAIEALASLVQEEMPETLVNEATQRLLGSFIRQLEARKIPLDQYLTAREQDADQLLAELRAQATEQVKADLALRAVADAEELEVNDDELAAEIQRLADESNRPVGDVARQVAEGSGLERLRSDIRNSKAVEWLLDHVEVVDEQGNPMDRTLLLEHEGVLDDSELTATQDTADGSEQEDPIAQVANDTKDNDAEDNDAEEGRA